MRGQFGLIWRGPIRPGKLQLMHERTTRKWGIREPNCCTIPAITATAWGARLQACIQGVWGNKGEEMNTHIVTDNGERRERLRKSFHLYWHGSLFMALSATALSLPVAAEDAQPADEQQGQLKEIVITAEKTPRSLQDTSTSVAVLSEDELQRLPGLD